MPRRIRAIVAIVVVVVVVVAAVVVVMVVVVVVVVFLVVVVGSGSSTSIRNNFDSSRVRYGKVFRMNGAKPRNRQRSSPTLSQTMVTIVSNKS